MPKATRRPESAPPAAPYPASKPKTQALGSPSSDEPVSFLDITLPGEDEHDVEVYDTCQVIRTKIKNLLGKDNHLASNAVPGEFLKSGAPKPWNIKRFLEAIGGVNSNSYGRFMKSHGRMGGAENGTFYGAYVFFEKKRIAAGVKKTAARVKCEIE